MLWTSTADVSSHKLDWAFYSSRKKEKQCRFLLTNYILWLAKFQACNLCDVCSVSFSPWHEIMIWSCAEVITNKKVCLIKNEINNGNQAWNALSAAQEKPSFKPRSIHTNAQVNGGINPIESSRKILNHLMDYLRNGAFDCTPLLSFFVFCFCCAWEEENIKLGIKFERSSAIAF